MSVTLCLLAVAPITAVLVSLRSRGSRAVSSPDPRGVAGDVVDVHRQCRLGVDDGRLATVEPVLALIAVFPATGIWYVLQSYGTLGQELRDLDAVHGFAGRVGGTLDVGEIGDSPSPRWFSSAAGWARHSFGSVRRAGCACPWLRGRRAAPVGGRTGMERPPGRRRGAGRRSRRTAPARHPARCDRAGCAWSSIVDEGNTFAALVVVDRNIQARFGREDVARVKSIAEQLAVSLRRGMLHERLEFEARHDALTNLPARTLFERHVGEAVAVAGDPRRPGW